MKKLTTLLLALVVAGGASLALAQPRDSEDWVCAREVFADPCPDEYPTPHSSNLTICFNEAGEWKERRAPRYGGPRWLNIGAVISTTATRDGIYVFPDKERRLEFLANVQCQ